MKVGAISSEKRARAVCIIGLLLQVVLSIALYILAGFNRSAAVSGASLYFAGGTLIWFVLIMIYNHRCRVAEESLESEELRRDRQLAGSTGIFEGVEEEGFLVQKKRLIWMYRWALPAFVLLTVLYLVGVTWLFWPKSLGLTLSKDEGWHQVQIPSHSMFFVAGISFVAFLFSRYVSGMSQERPWRMMKAGSVYLFGNAVVGLALVICLGLSSSGRHLPERVLADGICVLFLVLGTEFLVNLVLDFYRPRVSGEVLRAAFESRLIGLLSEPGGIAKSIAEAVNYQFGFEVSGTWFYKMLEQAVVPLIALSVLVLLAMTSFVFVDADEQGFVERFGRRMSEQPIGPGLHFKLPWPIETIRKANVGRIQETVIGEAKDQKQEKTEEELLREQEQRQVVTWTEEHTFVPAIDVLVATPELARLSEGQESGNQVAGDVAVSILKVSMPVQFRVRRDSEGFRQYMYNYAKPEDMLRDIAYRELVKQAVNFDYQKIMAEDRGRAAQAIHQAVQAKCDQLGLGLEILFVNLEDIHPPTESDVAKTFQQVVTSEQEKNTLIQSSRIDYTKSLVEAAGDVGRAEQIYDLIQKKEVLELSDSAGRAALDQQIEQLLLGDMEKRILPIRGEAGQRLAEARAEALRRIHTAAADANNFDLELALYHASPQLYQMRKWLRVLSGEELAKIRKYVLMVDPRETNVIIEMDERESAGLEIVETKKRP